MAHPRTKTRGDEERRKGRGEKWAFASLSHPQSPRLPPIRSFPGHHGLPLPYSSPIVLGRGRETMANSRSAAQCLPLTCCIFSVCRCRRRGFNWQASSGRIRTRMLNHKRLLLDPSPSRKGEQKKKSGQAEAEAEAETEAEQEQMASPTRRLRAHDGRPAR